MVTKTSITMPELPPARCRVCGRAAMLTIQTDLCWVCHRLKSSVDLEVRAEKAIREAARQSEGGDDD